MKHGGTNTRLYKIWGSMKERCYRKKHSHYKNYGGRGIKICEEWKDFSAFQNWAYQYGYDDTLTIDRIDVDGNYEPSNCRWVTMKEQENNRRNNRVLVYKGVKYTASQLANLVGLNVSTIFYRLYKGWDIEDVVNRPLRERTRGSRPSKGYKPEGR